MAGFAYGFDDGGEVDDNSGALPVDGAPEATAAPASQQDADNSGALPVVDDQPAAPQAEPTSRSGLRAPHEALRDTGKAILSYLMGADAAPPEAQKKFVAGVQAEHPNVSPDDANVIAVHKAYELGGPEAAWQMVQFNRMAYDAKQSFAFAALRGTQGKPPDVQAAAQAATQASQHVLDGSSARFNATPDGFVTATVRGPTGEQSSFQMSPTDFARYLNVGADGQYDKVMESGGVSGTLQKIAGGRTQQADQTPKASSIADTYEDDDQDTGDMTPIYRRGTNNGSNFGKTPSTLDLSNGEDETFIPKDDLESRATRLFPSASQGEQRRAWIDQQQNKAAEGRRRVREAEVQGVNRLAVAKETGTGRVQAADVRGQHQENAAAAGAQSRERIAADKLNGARQMLTQRLKAMADREGDLDKRAQLRADYSLVNSPNFATMDGDAQREIMQRAGLPLQEQSSWFGSSKPAVPAQQPQAMRGGQQPQAAQPQQAQPQQAQRAPLSLKDQQALQWAKANPNDPRAAKILQHLGQ